MASKRGANPRRRAELIVRLTYIPDLSGRVPRVYPAVLIMGDRRGFVWLSKFFARMAAIDVRKFESPTDVYLHDHIYYDREPVNRALSHPLEFYVARLGKDRALTLKQRGIRRIRKREMFEILVQLATDAKRFIAPFRARRDIGASPGAAGLRRAPRSGRKSGFFVCSGGRTTPFQCMQSGARNGPGAAPPGPGRLSITRATISIRTRRD
jgi:hypothetical protein